MTGPVGSGKSTLLSAIAGEVSDTNGTIDRQGSIAYVPQVAWVFSGTIRENILFGKPYGEHKYARTIEACALDEDIKQFPSGDQTIHTCIHTYIHTYFIYLYTVKSSV